MQWINQCLGTETYSPPGCLARIPQRRPSMLHWYLDPFWLRVRRLPCCSGAPGLLALIPILNLRFQGRSGLARWHGSAATLRGVVVSWRVRRGGEMR